MKKEFTVDLRALNDTQLKALAELVKETADIVLHEWVYGSTNGVSFKKTYVSSLFNHLSIIKGDDSYYTYVGSSVNGDLLTYKEASTLLKSWNNAYDALMDITKFGVQPKKQDEHTEDQLGDLTFIYNNGSTYHLHNIAKIDSDIKICERPVFTFTSKVEGKYGKTESKTTFTVPDDLAKIVYVKDVGITLVLLFDSGLIKALYEQQFPQEQLNYKDRVLHIRYGL